MGKGVLWRMGDPERWFCPVCKEFLHPDVGLDRYVEHLGTHKYADLLNALLEIAFEAQIWRERGER